MTEREQIVVWLRAKATEMRDLPVPDDFTRNMLREVNRGISSTVERIATAIERGDHTKDQSQ